MQRIVCAALQAEDGSLLLGIRHYSADMLAQIAMRTDGHKFKHLHGENQGFVDNHGNYLNRLTALVVARHAGQLLDSEDVVNGKLYSENLY